MPTTTEAQTLALELTKANPNSLPAALKQVDLGNMFAMKSLTVSQTSDADVVLTEDALLIQSVRVTGGAAAAGARTVSDAGDTPSATLCTLGADRRTLTFEAGVTDAVIQYVAASATPLSDLFAPST